MKRRTRSRSQHELQNLVSRLYTGATVYLVVRFYQIQAARLSTCKRRLPSQSLTLDPNAQYCANICTPPRVVPDARDNFAYRRSINARDAEGLVRSGRKITPIEHGHDTVGETIEPAVILGRRQRVHLPPVMTAHRYRRQTFKRPNVDARDLKGPVRKGGKIIPTEHEDDPVGEK